jgi:hypothetical protein
MKKYRVIQIDNGNGFTDHEQFEADSHGFPLDIESFRESFKTAVTDYPQAKVRSVIKEHENEE